MRIGPHQRLEELLPNWRPAPLTCPGGFSGSDGRYALEISTHAGHTSGPVCADSPTAP